MAKLLDLLKTGEVRAAYFGSVPDLMKRRLDIDKTEELSNRLASLESAVKEMKPDHSTIQRPTTADMLRLGLLGK